MKRIADNLSGFACRVAALIREDSSLYLLIASYTIAGLALLHLLNASDRAGYGLYLERGVVMFCIIMPIWAFIIDVLLVVHRFDKRRILVFRKVFSPERLARFAAGLCLMVGMAFFFGNFTAIKNVLPLMHGGFPFDRLHADIDAALHFGVDPWRLVQPWWGTDVVRRFAEWNYNVFWFIICYGALFFVATSPRARHIRFRYMVGFMLVWIIVGNVLAGVFLSAGPAFYGQVTGDIARFGAQLDFLARSGDALYSAAKYQAYLWNLHEAGRTGVATGISAFPSVHVALISFNAFFLYSYSRRLGLLAFAYTGFVALSSVYLGWHYAIDAYAAIAVSWLVFVALKRMARTPTRVGTIEATAGAGADTPFFPAERLAPMK